MVGWHHRLSGHEFEYALGVGDGQGSLVCCSPWGHKELDRSGEDAYVDNPTMDLQLCEKRSLLVLDFGIWGLLITAA